MVRWPTPEKTRTSRFIVRRAAGASRWGGRNRSCSPTPTTHGRSARRAGSSADRGGGARVVRQQVAMRAIHATSVSGGSAPGATNNRSMRRVCSAVGRSSQTAEASASFGSTVRRMKLAGWRTMSSRHAWFARSVGAFRCLVGPGRSPAHRCAKSDAATPGGSGRSVGPCICYWTRREAVAAPTHHWLTLWFVDDEYLGGEEQRGDRCGVLQRGASDFGWFDDARLDHVDVLAGGRVEAVPSGQ